MTQADWAARLDHCDWEVLRRVQTDGLDMTQPELGPLNRQEVAALAGLAPWTRESGTMKGMRCLGGGRPEVRLALYMAALSATRCNSVLKPFYQRLRAKQKPAKVALTAVMRRLLIYMNHQLKALAATQSATQTGNAKIP